MIACSDSFNMQKYAIIELLSFYSRCLQIVLHSAIIQFEELLISEVAAKLNKLFYFLLFEEICNRVKNTRRMISHI